MMGTKWHSQQMADFSDRETFLQRERKKSERRIESVTMPVESFGICANKFCESAIAGEGSDLGDGWCQRCFDKGAGRRGHGKLSKTGTVRKVKGGTNEGRTDTSITKR